MLKLSLNFGIVALSAHGSETKIEIDRMIDEILKECFWDYSFLKEDIVKIVKSGSFSEKMFLFEKILSNSTNTLKALRIFTREDLKELFNKYSVPVFNNEYMQKKKDIAEFVFFNKKTDISSLKWRRD